MSSSDIELNSQVLNMAQKSVQIDFFTLIFIHTLTERYANVMNKRMFICSLVKSSNVGPEILFMHQAMVL